MNAPTTKQTSPALLIAAISTMGFVGIAILLGGIFFIVRSTAANEREKITEVKDELLQESPKEILGTVDGLLGDVIKTVEGVKDEAADQIGDAAMKQANLSPKDEREIGKALEPHVLKGLKVSTDKNLFARVERLMNRLLKIAPTKFDDVKLGVIDDDTVNAFAMPGGIFYVHRGLIEAFGDDDDMLLFVLAHELGHCNLNHTSRSAAIIALSMQANVPGGLDRLATQQVHLAYSEKQEFAADAYACSMLHKLGVSLDAGARAMETIGKKVVHSHGTTPEEEKTTTAAAVGAFRRHFETHPEVRERIRRIKAWKPSAT